MVETLHIEILTDWREAAALEKEWNDLWARSPVRTPFHTFEWMSCWYQAFCAPGALRLILVRDGERLRALLPGMLMKRRLGGLSLNSFCYAGTGQTPQCGVLAGVGDAASIRAALRAVAQVPGGPVDLVVLPDIEVDSPTWSVLTDQFHPQFFVYAENAYQDYVYRLPGGSWEGYLASKSSDFRKRMRKSIAAAQAFGPLEMTEFQAGRDLGECLPRLQALDARTWQGQVQRGVLPDGVHLDFYRKLSQIKSERLHFLVFLLSLGGTDVAFLTAAYAGHTAFLRKTGYDAEFKEARPGLLIHALLTERLAGRGVSEFALGPDETELKLRLETHRCRYESFWVVNRETVRGRALLAEFKAQRLLKTFWGARDENAPRAETSTGVKPISTL